MDARKFTQEGMKQFYDVSTDPKIRSEIEEALNTIEGIDEITRQTGHTFANREGLFGDLTAEVELYLKEEERKAVLNTATQVLYGVGSVIKGLYILGETAVISTGKGLKGVYNKVKTSKRTSKKSEKNTTDNDIEKLKMELEIKRLQLEIEKIKLEKEGN